MQQQLNTTEPHIHVMTSGRVILSDSNRNNPGNRAIPDANTEKNRSRTKIIFGLKNSVTYFDKPIFMMNYSG